ncbi:MAG: outer membrane receptor for ferrienterochelin and colicins [Phenylobacterium sp.]|jgi:outer membrane receptor for ferrienterochelin and colicins
MNKASCLINMLIIICLLSSGLVCGQTDEVDPFNLPLEQLFNTQVSTASGWDEALRDAPAAMMIISRKDIEQRGYSSLGDIFADLPGFDAIGFGTTAQIVAYQRGYRTTAMQRTLIAINGVLDNHLWTHRLTANHQYPMTAIERIEVLYGPAGSIYGPNAFLGVVNIITRQPDEVDEEDEQPYWLNVSATLGEDNTRGFSLDGGGKLGDVNFNFALQQYRSDGASLDDYPSWGFANANWLNNTDVWGPVLQHQSNGENYGHYLNPDDDWGLLSEISYHDTTLGVISWSTTRGYGLYYAFDHAQPNASWQTGSRQFYLKHDTAINHKLKSKTLLKYHISDYRGDFAEAMVDSNEGQQNFSYVSISDWNTDNDSWKFRQDFEYQANDQLKVSGGLKYARKDLTKAYDICNYYADSFCSADNGNDDGPHGLGAGIFHSTDAQLTLGPPPLANIPRLNKVKTSDKGAYVQLGWLPEHWRFSASLRWDDNSVYGAFFKPRLSAIHHLNDQSTIKLIYAEAFQEPAPQQLYGGWTGRKANPDLQPEEVSNIELILMHQQGNWSHDVSLYHAKYNHVIKEEAQNAGKRDVTGVEYRGNTTFANPLGNTDSVEDITANFYYSWTDAKSAITYDHDIDEWIDGRAELGDIARHKISAAVNLPWSEAININLKANWVGDRTLYLRNKLRAQGKKADSYTTVDLTLNWSFNPMADHPVKLKLAITNLFDKAYYHPGGEAADSGDDFTERAQGVRNSLVPQVGRRWLLSVGYEF